jgi:hypothetical protein
MALTRTIDVQDFMIFHKLSSYQIRIIALCFLIVAIDGFDTAANAVGHSGSVIGSMFGGAILASGLGLPVAFAIVGIPVIIAGLSMFPQGRLASQPVHHTAPEALGGIDTTKVALQH